MNKPIVYDKGKYHDETVMDYGLPDEQASVHTAFFLGWLIENNLYSEEFCSECKEQLEEYKSRKTTAIEIYDWWDRCLIDDMLNDEGNAFAQAYFDFDTGAYLSDYVKVLVGELPSEFHVQYSWGNQEKINAQITQRYAKWKAKQNKKPWEFWK